MNILDVLEHLDGHGLILVDDNLIAEALTELGLDTASKVVL